MTNNLIYLFLRTWIQQVVNTELSNSFDIIQEYDNGPMPAKPYFSIDYASPKTTIGTAGYLEPNVSGVTTKVLDKQIQVEIKEIGSDGLYLDVLVDSLERQDIKDLFSTNKVAIMNVGGVIPIPALDNNKWIKQSVLELTLGIASSVDENSGLIENMKYSGTVKGAVGGDKTIPATQIP